MSSNDDQLRKIEDQAKHQRWLSASCNSLPSVHLLSPIGKIKQREPGPITSTPRVDATIRPNHIHPSNFFDKLSHIREDIAILSNEKKISSELSSVNSISSSETNLHLIGRVDRSRSVLSNAMASPLEKYGRQVAVTKDFHEKRKITWGGALQTTDVLEIKTLKNPLTGDKAPASPMQVSIDCISNLDTSKRSSGSGEVELLRKDKKMTGCKSRPTFIIRDNYKTEKNKTIPQTNMMISTPLEANGCSSSQDEKENIQILKLSNAIEEISVSSASSEGSICISSISSPTELLDEVEESVPVAPNKLAAVSVHDISEDDIQIIGHFSPSHRTSTSKSAQKILGALSRMELETQLKNLENLKRNADLSKLPDCGRRLLEKIKILRQNLNNLNAIEKDENVAPKRLTEKKEANIQKKEGPPTISVQPLTGGNRLFGGKMTENRISLANAVTGQVLAQMHNSLANVPENVKTDTPAGLLTELMPHQKEGLTWLLWREKQSLPGGILADDMGLGKTLSMISLLVNVKGRRKQNEVVEGINKNFAEGSYLIPSKTTLIIAPASLIFQWEAEFQKHVKSGFLSRYLFHGPKQKRDINAECLAQYDVVITTYGIVSKELSEKFTAVGFEDESVIGTNDSSKEMNGKGKVKRKVLKKSGSVLSKIAWERVILDEAHQIKNRASLISKACCKIPAAARWCLTGTPIHNNLWDLYSLIRFLRVVPFDEEAVWKEYILSAHSSSQRLNTLVKGLLLRREKNQLCAETNKPIVNLSVRTSEEIVIKFESMEKKVYDYIFQVSRQQVKELIKTREERERNMYGNDPSNKLNKPYRNPFSGGSGMTRYNDNFQAMTCVLTLLMRLRQACVHFALIRQAVDMESLQTLGVEGDENAEMLSKCFSNMSLLNEKALIEKLVGDEGSEQIEQLFHKNFVSAKLKKLLEHLDYALSCGDKCVIVSQWTSLLNILEQHLGRKKVLYTSINGKVSSNERQNRANSFNETDSGPRVMLLSLTAGGVGLNLIGGNHLFLIDLHWNPALEQQACDRIYRIGQTKNVFVHKLVCLETIEERVLALQRIKQTLAKDVLEGVASKKLSKLTIADLKYLFDLGRPHNDLANFATTVPSKFIPSSIISITDARSSEVHASIGKHE